MKVVRCRDIETVLSGYVMDELEPARARMVRRHIDKCARCRAAERDIRATLAALRVAAGDTRDIPRHLDRARVEQALRARTHPVVRWVERHLVVLALVIAGAVAFNIGVLTQRRLRRSPAAPWQPVEVRIREFPPSTNGPGVTAPAAGHTNDVDAGEAEEVRTE